MKALRVAFRLALLIGFGVALSGSPATAQIASPKESQPPAPGLRKLIGDDIRRAAELDKAVEAALDADRWDEAVARAEELLALRTRAQGQLHFETVTAQWMLKSLRQVAAMPHEDRAAYQSIKVKNAQAGSLFDHGKYAEAQPLYEKSLEIVRRLLTDENPQTASNYDNVAFALVGQGKYAQAQPLFEKELKIVRRLLTDDHPDTAVSYNGVGLSLQFQGKSAQAQSMFEKALEIRRRLLTDNDTLTAQSYGNVASSLRGQAKFAQAQPLFEKALEIRRRLFTDNNPDTATSYFKLAANLADLGKFAEAQPQLEKALEIRRRLLSDDHPETAQGYSSVASNLCAQDKYAEAQPLFEKALDIFRRLLTDDHPMTAISYNNLAVNLAKQEKYAEAQPLYEKALDINRRTLTDQHHETVVCYLNLAMNLEDQEKFAAAQLLNEKALEINRRLFTDDHPRTAECMTKLASTLNRQGQFTQAQSLYEKALEIDRRILTDDHPDTASAYSRLASNLHAQGKYREARDLWLRAVTNLDRARLRAAFSGLERASDVKFTVRPVLAAVLARLGEPVEAWNTLEEGLGRGLLDELAGREDQRLSPEERARLRELTTELEGLDKLVQTTPANLHEAERAKRFEDLKHRRELASIALGEFQAKLVQDHGPLAGQVAKLNEIQAALPADAALITWVDFALRLPGAADVDGEHWGVVVRSQGTPNWVAIDGTGPGGLWTEDDTKLPSKVRTALRHRPAQLMRARDNHWRRCAAQRLEPLQKALGRTSDGQPPSQRLIILPSRAMAGIPIEALLAPDDMRTVSYAPSATVFKHLREQPRPDRHAGLLALGDPIFERPEKLADPVPGPDHGLLINLVAPGSNGATHGLQPGDVLLAYNGHSLNKDDDLKIVTDGDQSIVVDVWRDGRSSRRDLAAGKLGVRLDPRPAPVAIAEERKLRHVLVAASGAPKTSPPCRARATR